MPKRVKCPNPVNGIHYGIMFKDGVSEPINSDELIHRLCARGYTVIEEKKAEKSKVKQKRGK